VKPWRSAKRTLTLALLAAELARAGLLAEPRHQLRREVRAEELVEAPQLARGLLEEPRSSSLKSPSDVLRVDGRLSACA
jgi:hypothetical protein